MLYCITQSLFLESLRTWMFIILDCRHLFTFILCIMYTLWIFYHTWLEKNHIYIFKAMCAWYITYRWKNDDDQKSWKSCPICPRNREGAGSRYFSDLVHLMSSTNFVVIMPHEVPSLMNYTLSFIKIVGP